MAGPTASTVPIPESEIPSTATSDWDLYLRWAILQHDSMGAAFRKAEDLRKLEDDRWLKYYQKVYENDWKWWQKVVFLALNAIQLWALWRQFRDQKDLADKQWDIAIRIQTIAEEMFAFYEGHYRPQEVALSRQIDDYFNNPKCIDYNQTAGRFEANVRSAFLRSKGDFLRCSSQHCGFVTPGLLGGYEFEMAKAVSNARTGAFRYDELRKEYLDDKWLDYRMRLIQIGRNISDDGQSGFMKAFNTFKAFGADPGAALSQLLTTFSSFMGSLISSPIAPTGKMDFMGNAPPVIPWEAMLTSVRQTGDIHQGKQGKYKSAAG